ncbi:hypothetical protein LCGC14_2936540, partial [marine sediment metagenome]
DVDDTLSAEVDLGGNYEFLTVLIPTITNSTVTITVAESSGGTFFPVYDLKAAATGDFAQITTAATTSHEVVFNIGGVQYIKVLCGSTQTTTDKTFRVRGFNRD